MVRIRRGHLVVFSGGEFHLDIPQGWDTMFWYEA